MKTVLTAVVGIALGALLFSVPMVGAANGDGTGPDGKGCRMMNSTGDATGGMMGQSMGCRKHCRGQGMGKGMGFVDKDGDGVCDHYTTAMANGATGNGGMMKNGQGAGFVDADGNGICDHHPDNGTVKKRSK